MVTGIITHRPWLAIPGATTMEELDWLHRMAHGKKFIYEIGSYLGRSTIAMLETGAHVYAVDDFYGSRDEGLSEEQRAAIYNQFLANTKDYRNLHVLKCDHAGFVPVKECDMVFIDGDHSYENVKRDILKFNDHKDILICGHDFEWWPGVTEAVQEIFGNKFTRVEQSIWFVNQ